MYGTTFSVITRHEATLTVFQEQSASSSSSDGNTIPNNN